MRAIALLLMLMWVSETPVHAGAKDDDKATRTEVFQWLRKARGSMLAGDQTQARKLVADARTWASRHQDKLATAWAEQLAGEIEFTSDKGKSAAAFTAALSAFTDLKNAPGMASCHLNLGRLALAEGKAAAALKHQEKAVELFTHLNRAGALASALRDQGAAFKALKQLAEARAVFARALAIYRAEATRNASGELQVLGELAHCSDGDQAQQHLAAAIQLAEKLKEPSEEAQLRASLGTLLHRQGKLEEARKHYEAALRIQAGRPDQKGAEAANRNNLGALLQDLGDPKAALLEFTKALKLLADLPDKAGQARTWYNVALVHESQAQDAKALEAYEKALTLRRELNDYPGMVRILDNQALLHASQGNAERAQACREQADKLRKVK